MRYHPMTVVFRIYELVKSSIVAIFFLFVLKHDSEFWLWKYGKYAFVIFVIGWLIFTIVAWFVEKYEWKDRAFQIHKGVFVKKSSTIPFSRIQNVTRKTTIFHKLFGLTSLTFETAMDGEEDSIQFEVLTKKHANELIELVQAGKENQSEAELETTEQTENPLEEKLAQAMKTIHFTPERKDLWRASFTSLSFLAIIPIVIGLFEYVEPLLGDSERFEGIIQFALNSKWLLGIVIILAIIIAVAFGVSRTFIRYGKYEISSDATHIYINRGVLDESYFAIAKSRVQGLELEQTFLKRIFGLVEVKLISSASPTLEDAAVNVNSLYPFLPVAKAYKLIEEILPIYQVNENLERLPRIALWLKLMRPSWVWIIATAALFYFKPDFLYIPWWGWSLILLGIIILNRILDYIHTRYVLSDDQIQWWHGGLTSRMFITKRRNVVEMGYTQSRLQNRFQVASITTINRSTPSHMETLEDIPLDYALAIRDWYFKRSEDVELVNQISK